MLLASLAALAGCSQGQPSIEEKVVLGVFTNFVAAQTYDEQCNTQAIANGSPEDKEFVYWHGNQQIIVMMISAPMKRRHPSDTVGEGVERLTKIKDKVIAKARSILSDKGCASPEADRMKAALKTFTEMPPWILHSKITEEILQKGGTITVLTDEENEVSEDRHDGNK